MCKSAWSPIYAELSKPQVEQSKVFPVSFSCFAEIAFTHSLDVTESTEDQLLLCK